MVWVRELVFALAVVQKRKQLHHQQVSPPRFPNGHGVLSHPRPMRRAVVAIAVQSELVQDGLQKGFAVKGRGGHCKDALPQGSLG
jgi:hypothetical protein